MFHCHCPKLFYFRHISTKSDFLKVYSNPDALQQSLGDSCVGQGGWKLMLQKSSVYRAEIFFFYFSSSSNASPSEGAPLAGYGCTPNSLPKFQHPSHELLKENGFTQQVYHKYRRRCLTGKLLHAPPHIFRSFQVLSDTSFLPVVPHP